MREMVSKRIARSVAGLVAALLVGAGLVFAASAQALPPEGPRDDVAGTGSRVWPTEVRVGDTLNFEVSGFPANETVYIKIDDGTTCSDTSHGACVYATQKLDANGYASGSLVVPDIGEGAHWLRMLATGDKFDTQTGDKIGYTPYSRRGGNDFTVIAGGSSSGGGAVGGAGGTGGSGGSGGTGSGDAGTVESGELSVDVAGEPAEESASMDELTENVADETAESADAAAPAESAAATAGSQESFPVLGVAVLGGALVIGAAGVIWALLHRRRLSASATPPAAAGADGGADAPTRGA